MRKKKSNKIFLGIVLLLCLSGFIVFWSASLGKLDNQDITIFQAAAKQGFVLLLGLVAMLIAFNIPYTLWRKYALPIFIVSIITMFMVFIPGLGIRSGGASRWIDLGFISFQPAEFFKFAFILYYSAWLASIKQKVSDIKWGLGSFLILIGIAGIVLVAQPDTGTLGVIFLTGIMMYYTAGAKKRHILLALLIGVVAFAGVVSQKEYIQERIMTFLDPGRDNLGASYQINQSLITIGSGGTFGRGFGQSIQKFESLPQPMSDSIYAVLGEEFGFLGASSVIILFILFAIWGLKIAVSAPDSFSRLFTTGIVIIIVFQSFINMAAMLSLAPLTGLPLIFYSQGGTALLFSLLEAGIVLQVSKHNTKK